MKQKPDIDPVSKKIMQEGTQSAYSQMKVEDRLRLKGSKLKEVNSNIDNRSYLD